MLVGVNDQVLVWQAENRIGRIRRRREWQEKSCDESLLAVGGDRHVNGLDSWSRDEIQLRETGDIELKEATAVEELGPVLSRNSLQT